MASGLKKSLGAIVAIITILVIWQLWQIMQIPAVPEGIACGNGRIEAVQTDISTKISGRVESIVVQEGDLVDAGQVVATIETNQLRAQLLRAQADVAIAQSLVASAQATIAQTKAQQLLAEQELARSQELVKKQLSSKEDYDTKVSQLTVAKANVAAAQATLVSKQRSVDASKANVTEVQTQIDDATLFSPSKGRILYRLAEPGEVIGSGGKVLTLLNLNDIYMEVFLPATQVQRISIGAPARIKLDAVDIVIPATVSFVSPESQFTPKTVETASEREKLMFRVKVRIPQALVRDHIEMVKTGVRGVAYIQLTPLPNETIPPWPSFLEKLPQESLSKTTETL
ncbi:HlyD family secretion protein [Paraglaciecola arctica]|uniref:HlyD family secretion protein n=1 Tax=Paraglaciecola arctica TaxID=1128911 RepID=UPI001C07A3B6|nr:HlyD family efflux transporter periplasmic adaptor subunit [Paraglaciecola arctica]MBU3005443.1 HlyD family efflux transporter periplasmic adaptor subunit [Paraglaciecola arctica]